MTAETKTSLAEWGDWTETTPDDMAKFHRQFANFDRPFEFPNGRTTVRFLPGTGGERTPFTCVYSHWFTMPGGMRRAITCNLRLTGDPCPICDRLREINDGGTAADLRGAEDAKASAAYYARGIIRGMEELGAQAVRLTPGLYSDMKQMFDNPALGGDFSHPTGGFDVLVVRMKKGDSSKYSATASTVVTPLSKEKPSRLPDLSKFARVATPEMQREGLALLGGFAAPRPAGGPRAQDLLEER